MSEQEPNSVRDAQQENPWEELEKDTPMLALRDYFDATSPTQEQIAEYNRRQQEQNQAFMIMYV